jgi:pyruvate/2-oxoglutarate dehydrogenase complex dihydrolipoamide dehydrogenase (E3) component
MPSKTLLASSERAAAVRDGGHLGVRARFEGLDLRAVQLRKRRLVDEFADYRAGQLTVGKFDLVRGQARFIDPHTVLVRSHSDTSETTESLVRGRYFLVATGSRSFLPEVPGLQQIDPLDSDGFLEAETLPRSVTILGGGAIALEAATFYAGTGVPVTLLQRSARILKEADPDVSDALAEGLRARGVTLRTQVTLRSCVLNEEGAKCVQFTTPDCAEEQTVASGEVLCAMGRIPFTEALELRAAGIFQTGPRLEVSETQQSPQPHIFGAGDVSGPVAVVHLAIAEAEVAVRNILRLTRGGGEPLEKTDYRIKLLAVFSEPGFAMAGITEQEAARVGRSVLSASYPFADHGKSMVAGCTDGFVKLIVDAVSREIVGAAVVGSQACELIHEIAVAMHFRATAADLARVPHYHPTLSEIWTYPAEDLA